MARPIQVQSMAGPIWVPFILECTMVPIQSTVRGRGGEEEEEGRRKKKEEKKEEVMDEEVEEKEKKIYQR